MCLHGSQKTSIRGGNKQMWKKLLILYFGEKRETIDFFFLKAIILLLPVTRYPDAFKTQKQSKKAYKMWFSKVCAFTIIKCSGYTLPFQIPFGFPRKAKLLLGWKTLISLWKELNDMAACNTRRQHWVT